MSIESEIILIGGTLGLGVLTGYSADRLANNTLVTAYIKIPDGKVMGKLNDDSNENTDLARCLRRRLLGPKIAGGITGISAGMFSIGCTQPLDPNIKLSLIGAGAIGTGIGIKLTSEATRSVARATRAITEYLVETKTPISELLNPTENDTNNEQSEPSISRKSLFQRSWKESRGSNELSPGQTNPNTAYLENGLPQINPAFIPSNESQTRLFTPPEVKKISPPTLDSYFRLGTKKLRP